MAEEFDPVWEYRVSDSEVEELIAESGGQLTGIDRMMDYQTDSDGRSTITGIRFGRGNPDYCVLKLAFEKESKPATAGADGRHCWCCSMLFFPERPGQRHCGDECKEASRQLRAKERADRMTSRRERHEAKWTPCVRCQEVFLKSRRGQRYCGHECYLRTVRTTGQKRAHRPSDERRQRREGQMSKRQRFVVLWRSGVPRRAICRELGINQATLTRWRRADREQGRLKRVARLAMVECRCRKVFKPAFGSQRYCSMACVPKTGRKRTVPEETMATCPGCEREYVRKRTDRGGYCSAECSKRTRAEKFRRSFALQRAKKNT